MNFLSIAIEEFEESVEEIEYSQFLKLSPEQLKDALSKVSGCRREVFSESKLPTENGFSRLRHYINGDESTYELTTKIHTDDVLVKHEHNVEVPLEVYRSLNSLATSQVFRVRIYVPITRNGEAVMRKNGPLEWELDLYITAGSGGGGTHMAVCNWVKLELEVDAATLTDVVEHIPFDYDSIIISSSTIAEERAQITHLYNNVYNVIGKFTDTEVANFKVA